MLRRCATAHVVRRISPVAFCRCQGTVASLREDVKMPSVSASNPAQPLDKQRLDLAWPSLSQVRSVVPKTCFERCTATSFKYLSLSLAATAVSGGLGWAAVMGAWSAGGYALAAPAWLGYSAVTGTCAVGMWVVAHECGHSAFSDNRSLNAAVGFTLHSLMLAPYFSWQRSHAVHHMRTNHLFEGETHVPPRAGEKPDKWWTAICERLGNSTFAFGSTRLFVNLVLGWPWYLITGRTGGSGRGSTSHFWPWARGPPASGDEDRAKKPVADLFPGRWKRKVAMSNAGIAGTLGLLAAASCNVGVGTVALAYGGPWAVTNAWLVVHTWLQHTDTDVPHYSGQDWTFVKGCFATVDRPYHPVLDLLHHRIGTTHVVHHLFPALPHYHAVEATAAVREHFPDLYIEDPTPPSHALWRVALDCVAVRKVPGSSGTYVFAPGPSS